MANLNITIVNKTGKIRLNEYCEMIIIKDGFISFCVELKNPKNNIDRINEFNEKLGRIGIKTPNSAFLEFTLSMSLIDNAQID